MLPHERLRTSNGGTDAFEDQLTVVLANDHLAAALDMQMLAQAGWKHHHAICGNLHPMITHGSSPRSAGFYIVDRASDGGSDEDQFLAPLSVLGAGRSACRAARSRSCLTP